MPMTRCGKCLACISFLQFLIAPRLIAGDLGGLTKDQVSNGYGQLQEAPASTQQSQSGPSNVIAPLRRPQSARLLEQRDDETFGSQFLKFAIGVVGAGAYRVAQKIDPPGIPLWDVQQIPRELQFNTIWYFESRTNQQLLVGQSMSNASRFDWTGTPGFQVRFATQPILRIGQEFLFDYAKHDELFSFSNVTDFATIPNISFAENTVTTERVSSLAVGQWNVLLREQPYTFVFAGLRWWHQDDELRLNVVPTGAAWNNKSRSEAPYFQMGGQLGSTGTRWMWLNRIGVGMGAARNTSLTTVTKVIGGSTDRIEVAATNFSALVDVKSEFAMAFTEHLSVRIGAQLIGISGRVRSSEQIDVTNLATGEGHLNNDSILISALFAGASYQF